MPQSLPSKTPADACRFAAEVQLGAIADTDPLAPAPITVKARSLQPVDHPYWGKIAHDMSGMFKAKPVLAFDYCHNADEILGPCTETQITAEGLIAKGTLVPFVAGDRASEVKFKGRKGVPYEASIDWCGEGILIEQVGEGAVAQVNGYQFEGPGVIVRKWPLRGVAICPHGADFRTETQFAAGDNSVMINFVAPGAANPKKFTKADNLQRIASGIKFHRPKTQSKFSNNNAELPAARTVEPIAVADDNHSRIARGIKLPGRK